eukprot:6081721-Ditylum_brightwellii.AAC.1
MSPHQRTNSFIALQGRIKDEENKEDEVATGGNTEAAKCKKPNSKAKREADGNGNNKAKKVNLGIAIDVTMDEIAPVHQQENNQA